MTDGVLIPLAAPTGFTARSCLAAPVLPECIRSKPAGIQEEARRIGALTGPMTLNAADLKAHKLMGSTDQLESLQ